MNNIQKAIALIESFMTGDTEIAEKYVSDNYIQHNLEFFDGKEKLIETIKYISSLDTKTLVTNVRAFEDANIVILHNLYNFAGAGEQVAFDIFKFEDNLIVEHWDNLMPTAKANKSGHLQIDGTNNIIDLHKTNENKVVVENFVKDILMGRNIKKINSYFDGDNYIQHNPQIGDGLSGLVEALKEMESLNIKMTYDKIHNVFGSGNFVLVISEGSFANEHTSFYDLFRVENNKIAEHWDVVEPINKNPKHNNGKF